MYRAATDTPARSNRGGGRRLSWNRRASSSSRSTLFRKSSRSSRRERSSKQRLTRVSRTRRSNGFWIQKPFDRRVLLTLVNRCLELRSLREERELFLKRVERELEEARRFQLSLLPPPRFDRAGVSVAARYIACTELAGDFYDYAE